MDLRSRRGGVRTGVVTGPVWKTRMKLDGLKGGSKMCNGDDNSEESLVKLRRRSMGRGVVSGKIKTWKGESIGGNDKNLIQKGEGKSNPEKNCGDQCKEVSVSGDGLKTSPDQMRKLKSEGTKAAVNAAVDKFDRRPFQTRNKKSEVLKGTCSELGKEVGESGEAIDKSPVQLKKAKSVKILEDTVEVDVADSDCKLEQNSILSRKSKSESARFFEEPEKGTDVGVVGEVDSIPIGNEKTESDETCKEFGVCQEKAIPNSADDIVVTKNSSPNLVETACDAASEEFDEGDDEEEDIDEEIETEIEKDDFDIKEINISEPKNVLTEVKKFHQVSEKPGSISLTVKKPTPLRVHSPIHQSFSKINSKQHRQSFPPTHGKLQTLVDLIMWRDVSRSAFVFMIGSFTIVSSSYVKDVNVSLISVISYVGLVYLTAIFLYRSLVCRGVMDVDDSTRYVLGEEEATWVLTLLLPYLNEFLLKLRAMFSGDPATTMKLAVLLFALARCGSSITIWKMVKFGFFGVFTVPKVCSLYSSQLIAYASFWVHRFQDAWNSCTQKKAVGISIFILVWNFSSVVARIWAAFMLYVGFRYYQQNYLAKHNWVGLEVEEEEDDDAVNDVVPVAHYEDEETTVLQKPIGRQRQRRGPTVINHKRSK